MKHPWQSPRLFFRVRTRGKTSRFTLQPATLGCGTGGQLLQGTPRQLLLSSNRCHSRKFTHWTCISLCILPVITLSLNRKCIVQVHFHVLLLHFLTTDCPGTWCKVCAGHASCPCPLPLVSGGRSLRRGRHAGLTWSITMAGGHTNTQTQTYI